MSSFSVSPRGRGRGFKRKQEDSSATEAYYFGHGRGRARAQAKKFRNKGAFQSKRRARGKAFSFTPVHKYEEEANEFDDPFSNIYGENGTTSENSNTDDFEAYSYGIESTSETQNDATHSRIGDKDGGIKIKLKSIKKAEVQSEDVKKKEDSSKQLKEEVLHVPDTRDLDERLLKERLLQEISSLNALKGISHSVENPGDQMFLVIKHNDSHRLQEAKKIIAPMIQCIIAELRCTENAPTSNRITIRATDHPTPDCANSIETDLTPLEASTEDFLSIMSSGGPIDDDQPVYGFLTNIPRGVAAKDLHGAMMAKYQLQTKYSGPDFPFLSMFNFVDRSLSTKFSAAKFPSRKLLQHVIRMCSPVEHESFSAFIKEVPPEDPKIKPIAARIRNILQASICSPNNDQEGPHVGLSEAKGLSSIAPDGSAAPFAKRPRGVFPGGIQPEKVVVVIDDSVSHLNLLGLKKKGYEILTGSNLDVHGYCELITGDTNYTKDGVLYVVQPGLDFFLKNMKAMDLVVPEADSSEKLLVKPKKFAHYLSNLVTSKLTTSSLYLNKESIYDIFNDASQSLLVLNQCDLSKLSKSGEFAIESCLEKSSTSELSQHEDSDQEIGSASNKNPAEEKESCNGEKHLPPKSDEANRHNSASIEGIPMASPLHTLVTRALHLALALRNLILLNTMNSEVVFLGYPVEWLLTDQAQKVFPKMPETSLKHLTGSLIAALRLFNIFAANTWKLGGFPSLNFNNDPAVCIDECVHEAKQTSYKSRHGGLLTDQVQCAENNSEVAQELIQNKSKDKSIADAVETKYVSCEKPAEDELLDRSVDPLIYESGDDDMDTDVDAPRCKFMSENDSSKSCTFKNSSLEKSSARPTEAEGIDFDVEDQEEFLYDLGSEGDATECLHFAAFNAASTKRSSAGTSGDGHGDLLDLTQLKHLCVFKQDVTADVARVLDLITEHFKTKGSFPPWATISGASSDPSHDSLLAEYTQKGFYKIASDAKGQVMYQCTIVCNSKKLMNATDAEAHPYTRGHISKMSGLAKKTSVTSKGKEAKYLFSEAIKKSGAPPAPDQIKRLLKLGFLEQQEVGEDQHYKCLLCPKVSTYLEGVSLRIHLCSFGHLTGLVKALGTHGSLTVPTIENWPTVKRAMRYRPMDVVIVADNMHRHVLTAFIDMHPQVHLITVNNLLHGEAASTMVLSQWQEISNAHKSVSNRPLYALFLIVTGKDMMFKPSQYSLAANTSPDCMVAEHSKDKRKPEIKGKDDVIDLSRSDDEATKAEQEAPWSSVLQHLDQNTKESIASLVKLHSLLRVQLPIFNKVLVVPSLPLTVLPDTTPQPTQARVMKHQHAVVLPPRLTQAVSQAFARISEEVYSIHRANCSHENVAQVDETLLVKDTKLGGKSHCILSSPWHTAIEVFVLNGLHGLPAVTPNFIAADDINVRELGYRSHLSQGVVVGDYAEWIQHTMKYNNLKNCVGRGLSLVERSLRFHQTDIDFILKKAKLLAKSLNKRFVWYLTCPLPHILLQPKECKMCIHSGCDEPLKVWDASNVLRYCCDDQSLDSVSRNALVKTTQFLTLLQSKLPPMQFVTLFPIFPTTVISFGSINDSIHDEMHQLHVDFPRTFFSSQPCDQVLKPLTVRFTRGWIDLFRKVRLGHAVSFDPRSKPVDVRHIKAARYSLTRFGIRTAGFWLNTVSSILGNHLIGLEVELTPAIVAWLLGERVLPLVGPPEHRALEPVRTDCRQLLNQLKRQECQAPPAFSEPAFDEGVEEYHEHSGPHGRSFSPSYRSKSPRFGGSPIQRESPAPFLNPVAPPFMRTGSPSMRSRSPPQRGGAPPVQDMGPAAMRSSSPYRMNSYSGSGSPSRGSHASMRFEDMPERNLEDHYRDFTQPHSSQERRPRVPERHCYSPERDVEYHIPSRHFPGERQYNESQERRPPSVEENRFSPEPHHSRGGRFGSNPHRSRFSPDRPPGRPYQRSPSSRFSKAAAPFGGAPGPSATQFVFCVATASREQLSREWMNKLAWSFKISAQPTPGPKGSWRIQAPSARALFGAQRFLPAVRLLDQQLIVTVESSQSAVVPVTSLEEEEQYRERLEYVSRCYNEDCAPKLIKHLMNETSATFFRPGWQHLYTHDLSRTIPIVADAIRSLSLIPRSDVGSVRLVVVTPSADAVRVMMRVLKTVAETFGVTVVPIVNGSERTGPGVSVVMGAAEPLAQVGHGLVLQDLSALVVDDASVFLDDPTPKEALFTLLSSIGNRTRDYERVNKVAVAREDNASERSRMEAMLECSFAGGRRQPLLHQPQEVESPSPWENPWLQQIHEMQEQFQSYLQKQKKPLPPAQTQLHEQAFRSREGTSGDPHHQRLPSDSSSSPFHMHVTDRSQQIFPGHQQQRQLSVRPKSRDDEVPVPSQARRLQHLQQLPQQHNPRQEQFEARHEELESPQEQFGSGQEKYRSVQKQFGSGQEQYGISQEHYGSGQKEHRSGQEQYQPGHEQYRSGQEQYQPGHEQYRPGQEQYQSGQKHYRSEQEESGSGEIKFGSGQKQFGTEQKHLMSDQAQFGFPKGKLRSGQEHFGPEEYKFGSAQKQFGPGPKQFRSGPNQFGSGQEQFKSGPKQFVSGPKQLGSGQEQFRSGQKQIGSGQERFGSESKQFGSGPNQFGSGQEHFRSGPKQLESGQEQFRSGQKQFMSGQEQFGSGSKQFLSEPNQFGSGQEQFRSGPKQLESGQEQFRSGPKQFESGQEQSTPHEQLQRQQTHSESRQQQQPSRLLPHAMTQTSPQASAQRHQYSAQGASQPGHTTQVQQTHGSEREDQRHSTTSAAPGQREDPSGDSGRHERSTVTMLHNSSTYRNSNNNEQPGSSSSSSSAPSGFPAAEPTNRAAGGSGGNANPLVQRITEYLEMRKRLEGAHSVNAAAANKVVSLEYLANLTKDQLEQVPKVLLKELYITLCKDKDQGKPRQSR